MSTGDAVPSLTPNQISALVVLMAEARELTNNELNELAGFTLTGANNRALVNAGLVETNRDHRPFSHQLTDKGWKTVRELHTVPPPRQGGSAIRSLLTLLSNLDRSLDRLRVSHGEFFERPTDQAPEVAVGADPARPAVPTPVGDVDVAALIRAAYRELAAAPGGWVGLAELRDRLADQERSTVDDALRTLVRSDGVRIIPVANSKSLTARDRAAAVRIGDEDNHVLSIGPA